MIQRLRVWHRRLTFALVATVPPLVALALAQRQPTPALVEPSPARAVAARFPAASERVLWQRDPVSPTLALRARLVLIGDGAALDLEPSAAFQAPDPLVYWAAAAPADGAPPPDASLLGPLDGPRPTRLPLPPGAVTETLDGPRFTGVILIFSLATRETVGAFTPGGPGATRAQDP